MSTKQKRVARVVCIILALMMIIPVAMYLFR